jgi:hypothetical protein
MLTGTVFAFGQTPHPCRTSDADFRAPRDDRSGNLRIEGLSLKETPNGETARQQKCPLPPVSVLTFS